MAAEPKLSPGNGFFLKPDGTWGVSKVPAEVIKSARFIGNLRIRGYESAVFEIPSGQQWAQKIIEKPEDVETTIASSKIATYDGDGWFVFSDGKVKHIGGQDHATYAKKILKTTLAELLKAGVIRVAKWNEEVALEGSLSDTTFRAVKNLIEDMDVMDVLVDASARGISTLEMSKDEFLEADSLGQLWRHTRRAALNLPKIAAIVAAKVVDDDSPFDLEDVESKFGADEARWLSDQINKFWTESEDEDSRSEYEYVDNYRLAIKGDQPSMDKYDVIDSRGCCGSANLEFGPSPNGQTYMYGFNYGH